MKRNWAERFTGLTLAVNPIFTIIGLLYLSIRKTRGLIQKLKSDRVSLYFWLFLALSGVISILGAIDPIEGIGNYLIPFVFIWLYILGRWVIQNPETFVQDLIRGAAALALIAIIAHHFHLTWSIGEIRILANFSKWWYRGEILYVADNSLGLLFQAGVVGAIASLVIYWRQKKYMVENIIAVVLCSYGIMITASRGAMVGSLVGVLFLVLQYKIVLLLGGLSFGGLYLYVERFRSIFNMADHSKRMYIWRSSIDIIKDHPLFGVGPGNFGEVYSQYKPAAIKGAVTCAHSNYLNIFIGWGLIGGILFWGWHLVIFVRNIIQGLKPLQRVIMAILISYFVHVAVNELFAAYAGFLLGLLEHPTFKQGQD